MFFVSAFVVISAVDMLANLCFSVFSSLTYSETSLSITVLFVLLHTGWSISIEAKSLISFPRFDIRRLGKQI